MERSGILEAMTLVSPVGMGSFLMGICFCLCFPKYSGQNQSLSLLSPIWSPFMAVRIALLDDYLQVALDLAPWHTLPPEFTLEVFSEPFGSEVEAVEKLQNFEILVAMRERTRFPESLLTQLPNLRLLVTTGMCNRSIDMEFARQQGVSVCGTRMLGDSTAELTWALILGLVRKLPAEHQAMQSGGWHVGLGLGLKDKTLGLFGLGKLGSQVAKIGLAFGMRVSAWSENLTKERCAEVGVQRVEREELFRESDVLSIHVVLSERTRGTVGQQELSWMKPSAFLVNTSRGPIIEETALLNALEHQRIAGAGIDVYDQEPLPADHPLRLVPNALLTGHCGYVTRENFQQAYGDAVEDLRAWHSGNPVRVLNVAPA
jgi:phosphoglycerate dehydrogenase-like enzyme